MVTRIIVPRGCVRQLTIMGWVCHAAGILSIVTAVATDHWLRRVSDGDHEGIFPCCPTFTCGKSVVTRNDSSIEAFTDLLVVGMLLVGLGLILSLAHFCVMWRNDNRTLVGLSYLASGLVTVGGITLVAAAIEFVATVPGDMEDALRHHCQIQDNRVETGFSYELFVTGAAAFILAGILLFLGSCKQNNPVLPHRSGIRPSIAVSERSSEIHLESLTGNLTPQRRLSPVPNSAASFHNPLYNSTPSEGQYEISPGRMQRLTSNGHSSDDVFQQLACPPSYESLSEFFSPYVMDTEDREHYIATGSNFHCGSTSQIKPPTYDDTIKEKPPPYTDPN